ncbi:MAG: histidine kinase [Cyanobacteria bacterium P01_D01_bin.50]
MADNIKEQIKNDLQQVKETGQQRIDRIREIVRLAVGGVVSEFKEGSVEVRSLVKDAVSAVAENLQGKGSEIKEEITASIEGAVEAVNTKRREALNKTQTEVKQLQAQLDDEEEKIQQEVEGILTEIQETTQEKSTDTQSVIKSAVDTIKNSEEMALLQKRYAQLQAQLAVVRANLAARYGDGSPDVQTHLDDAKSWYDKTRPKAEEMVSQVKDKHSDMEAKLGEAGTAFAKKERQLKQKLRELLLTTAEWLKDKDSTNK